MATYPIVPYQYPIVLRPKPPTDQKRRDRQRSLLREVVTLLCTGSDRLKIHEHLKRHHNVGSRQADRYIAKAREAMVSEIGIPIRELVAEAAAFYRKILGDDGASVKEKLRARELLDKLLGLQAPLKVAQTTTDGRDVFRESLKNMTLEELDAISEAFQKAKQRVHA